MEIATIVDPFPKLSKTYILNEITGLIDRGHNVTIVSNADPEESRVHHSVSEYSLREKTFYYQDHAPDNICLKAIKAIPTLLEYYHTDPEFTVNLLGQIPREGTIETGRLTYWSQPFLNQDFDIIHCHFGPNGVIGAKLKQMGVPGKLVTKFHGYGVDDIDSPGSELYSELFETADHLLGNSLYTCDQIIQFGADESKVSHHPVAIDTDRFPCQPSSPDPTSDTVTVLTVARLSKEKGLEHMISAVGSLLERKPEYSIEYHVVGHGPLEVELKGQVEREGLEDVVTFCGSMTRVGVVKELARADLFVLPSLNEGLGVVLLEAQSSCLPVVASSVGGIPEAVDRGESAILVPPGDARALSEALEFLLKHPERWDQMGRHGRQYVEQNYHIDRLNEDLVDLYHSLLD
jgi:colanic acid/amylovoran biosynthesis glycosyltransferase